MSKAKAVEQDQDASKCLTEMLEAVLTQRRIKHGFGPPMAYFERVHDFSVVETVTARPATRRYLYQSFGADGPKDQGTDSPRCETLQELYKKTLANFQKWLRPARAVVWRQKPEVTKHTNGEYSVFFRCIQMDDNADEIVVTWHL